MSIDRDIILGALRQRIESGGAVLAAGCSAGIIARAAEDAEADLIVVYSTGRSRLMGLPTWRMGDSNAETLEMAAEILNVVERTPVVGGVEANDPTRRDLSRLVADYQAAEYSGIINFPTLTNMPDQRRRAEMVGYGFEREAELIRLASAAGLFTMAYVASVDDAVAMAGAGADCVVTHSGPTKGGSLGYRDDRRIDEISVEAERMLAAAISVKPDIIPLLHGGGLATPEDVREALSLTSAVGFVGASSIERIPIERAVQDAVRSFRDLPTTRRRKQ